MYSGETTKVSPDPSCATDDARAVQLRPANITADPRDEIEFHLPALRAFALVLVGQRAAADDIVAYTVVAAWANIHAFKPGTNMRLWLFGILHTIYFAERHRLAQNGVVVRGAFFGPSPPQAAPVAGSADPRFWRTFSALAVEQREALILTGPAGLSLDEAASVCVCTPATVQSRARLGRRKLAMIVPLDSGTTSTSGGRAPLEVTGRHRPAGTLSVPHRLRFGPPDGRGSAGGAHPTARGLGGGASG